MLSSLATAGEHFGHALGAYTQVQATLGCSLLQVSMLEGAPLYEQLQEDGQGAILSRCTTRIHALPNSFLATISLPGRTSTGW